MSGFSGVIVGLFLRPSEARRLAISGGEKPSDLHVTLVYLGDASDIDSASLALMPCAIESIAEQLPSFDAQVSGVGRFTNSGGEKQAFYASVNGHGLHELREYIVAVLVSLHIPVHNDFAFQPHITLDYLDPSQATPHYTPPSLPLHFNSLTLAIAGNQHSYVLKG